MFMRYVRSLCNVYDDYAIYTMFMQYIRRLCNIYDDYAIYMIKFVCGLLQKSGEGTGEVMAGTMCIKTGPISGQLIVNKKGFVPAQNIDFVAKIHNQSSKKVNVRVVLSQVNDAPIKEVFAHYFDIMFLHCVYHFVLPIN